VTSLETGHSAGPWWSDATTRAGYATTTTTSNDLSVIPYNKLHLVWELCDAWCVQNFIAFTMSALLMLRPFWVYRVNTLRRLSII